MTDLLLDSDSRSKVIDDLLLKLRENYVFPDVANAIEESIRARLSNGEYDSITTPAALCETLTAQMQEIIRIISTNFLDRPVRTQRILS